jgi:hypothetical protein
MGLFFFFLAVKHLRYPSKSILFEMIKGKVGII